MILLVTEEYDYQVAQSIIASEIHRDIGRRRAGKKG
jgi:hypothetical protein